MNRSLLLFNKRVEADFDGFPTISGSIMDQHIGRLIVSLSLLLFPHGIALCQEEEFLRWFRYDKKVLLSDKVTIGQVSFVDVDDAGNCLVTDCIGKRVYIFDNVGNFKTALEPDRCHPGFNMAPLKASFKNDNTILMLNSMPWGFRFGNKGQCLGGMDRKFTAPLHLAFDSKGHIYGYFLGRDENEGTYVAKMDSVGREIFRFGFFPKEFKNLIGRIEGGGLVVDDKGFVYLTNPLEPFVYVYDAKGKMKTTFGKQARSFRKVETDLSSSHAPQMLIADYGKVMKGKSINVSTFLLNKNIILVQYSAERKYGIQLYRLDGTLLNDKEIISDQQVILAKRNKIYVVKQPELTSDGFLPNPLIEVYSLRSKR